VTKVYQFFQINNRYCYISASDFKRILLLSYGICQGKTVNISHINNEIPTSISGCKTEDAQYKWLIQAFQIGNILPILRQVFSLLIGAFYELQQVVHILIDRTNWEIGLRKVNILSIGLLHKESIFIPLLHEDLGYKGNSDGQTRLNLISQLVKWWNLLCIPLPVFEIVGDREFIGEEWLKALDGMDINFVIRLKSGLKFYEWLDNDMSLNKETTKTLMQKHHVLGNNCAEVVISDEIVVKVVSVVNEGKDAKEEPYIYLITNSIDIENTGDTYRKRWKIETCFKHLKSGDFNLEDMNLEFPHKTDILMAILSLVYAFTIFIAEQELGAEPIKIQKYKNGKSYPRKSVFLRGKSVIAKIKTFEEFLIEIFKFMKKSIDNLLVMNDIFIRKKTG
jgi:hypothetical protein